MVHPTKAIGAVEQARHAIFIGLHLFSSIAALMAVPVWLVYRGAPTGAEAFGILLLQAPLVAAVGLAKGMSFRTAQMIASFGFISFGCLVAYTAPEFEAVAYALFVIALFEAANALDLRYGAATCASILTAVGVIVTARGAIAPPPPGLVTEAVLAAALLPVITYAGALAWAMARLTAIRIRRERRESESHQALSAALGDLVLKIDRSGAVLSCGAEAQPLFELTARDFAGRGLYERVHVADRPAFLQSVSDAFAGAITETVLLRMRTGTVRSARGQFDEPVHVWIEMRTRRLVANDSPARRVTDLAGIERPETAICIVRDVTKIKLHEEEIAEAHRIASRANASRDRFLANVSHELRTPLNAIIGFAEILAADEKVLHDPAKRGEYAGIIATSGHHLLSVVNSILDMSKLESGSFDISPDVVAPAPLLDQCFDIVKLKAAQSDIRLVRDYGEALSEIVADERACKQIVINLLANAVKFTPAGGLVTLSAQSANGKLTITVADTGIGIDENDLPHLGDPFFQASGTHARAFEGTGLGLSLVRGLVGLHGGTIAISSARGAGTCVTVRLPDDCRPGGSARAPAAIETTARSDLLHFLDPHTMVQKIA